MKKKLVILSISLLVSNLSLELKATPLPAGGIDITLPSNLSTTDWCTKYLINPGPYCPSPFTYYAGYKGVNFCGIAVGNYVFGQCYLHQNYVSWIPAATEIPIPKVGTPVIAPYVPAPTPSRIDPGMPVYDPVRDRAVRRDAVSQDFNPVIKQ